MFGFFFSFCLLGFFVLFALWNQHDVEWYFNLLLWKGQQLVFNGYRMVTCGPVPAAVTGMLRQTCSILSLAHISAPAGCLPPSQWTGLHLLLAQRRPFGEQMFSGCWVTGRDRRRISRKPGKGTLGPAAPTPPPIYLPCLAEISLIRAIGKWAFWSDCDLDCSVYFPDQSPFRLEWPFIYSGHKHFPSLCSMPGNLLSARNTDSNTSIPHLEEVTV